MDTIFYIRALEGYIEWIHANCDIDFRHENPLKVGDNTDEYKRQLEDYIDKIIK